MSPNPLIPQGTIQPRSSGASNLRIAVVTIVAIHVVFFGGLLLQGCKRDTKETKSNEPTNQLSLGPIEATNTASMYYTNPASLPAENTNLSATQRTSVAESRGPAISEPIQSMATNATPAPGVGEGKEYTVLRGDSFYKIAHENGISVNALKAANPNIDPAKLKAGVKIRVPAKQDAAATAKGDTGEAGGHLYTVKSGDTLTKIANQHGVRVSELRAANGLKLSKLTVGQKLKIPAKSSAGASTNKTSGAMIH